jgi:hypothetical protein
MIDHGTIEGPSKSTSSPEEFVPSTYYEDLSLEEQEAELERFYRY